MNFDLVTASEILYIKGKDCGYCNGSKPEMVHGYSLDSYREAFESKQLVQYREYPNATMMGLILYMCTPECYEKLMNRGFRRSGTFLYRPDMLRNCCRLYTIRTSLEFLKPTKEHRHNVNRWGKYLGHDVPSGQKKFDLKSRVLGIELAVSSDKFHTVIGRAVATESKYQLYKKYQMAVHHDKEEDVTMKGFKRFLCDTPYGEHYTDQSSAYWDRINDWRNGDLATDSEEWLGPIHECYYVQGQLIAIAVLDLLPDSVSSVYFIWDPDYAQFGLGTLSALREMVLTEMLGKKYYYMGYYIDDCPKMRYKAKFGGEILDLPSCKFVALDRVNDSLADGRMATFIQGIPADVPLNEPETTDTSEFGPGPLTNVAEQIYGLNGGAFASAARASAKIVAMEPALKDIASTDQQMYWLAEGKETLPLPQVSPGLVPLWQIREMMQDGTLSRLLRNVYLYDLKGYGYDRMSLPKDSAQLPQVVDLLRLVGPREFHQKILYLM